MNFVGLYCSVQQGNIKETHKLIEESAAYLRSSESSYANSAQLMEFLEAINLNIKLPENISNLRQEAAYYATCLECMPQLQDSAKHALLTSILWCKMKDPRDYDFFWIKVVEILQEKKSYLKALHTCQYISDSILRVNTIGVLIESLAVNKKLSLILGAAPLAELNSEVIKYLRKRSESQLGDLEQLLNRSFSMSFPPQLGKLRQNLEDHSSNINYSTILYSFLVENYDYFSVSIIKLVY